MVAVQPEPSTNLTAEDLCRGTARLLLAHGYVPLYEFSLGNGRRTDICALNDKNEIFIVEIKSSRTDFVSDRKWPEYIPFCDYFAFAVGADFPHAILPQEHGLIIADRHDGAVLRESPLHSLKAARRKAVTTRFARTAAARLLSLTWGEAALRLLDPASEI